MNLANRITILRILLIPFFISFILYGRWNLALLTFIIAVISDGIDGYIARVTKQRTLLGKMLDPMADKLLILSAFICLTVVKKDVLNPAYVKFPLYVPIIIISRDAIIVLGAILIYFTKGRLEPKPSLLGKITTFFQMTTIIAILVGFRYTPLLWNIAVGFTIVSAIDYIMIGSRLLNSP